MRVDRMEDEMKVFAMNDYDWMAGESLESVTELYLKEYNPDNLRADEVLDEPYELTEELLDRFRFHDAYTDGADGPESYRTFRQELNRRVAAGETFPCFFASAEY